MLAHVREMIIITITKNVLEARIAPYGNAAEGFSNKHRGKVLLGYTSVNFQIGQKLFGPLLWERQEIKVGKEGEEEKPREIGNNGAVAN